MKLNSLGKEVTLFLFFVLFAGSIYGQTTIFKRMSVIAPRAADPEGYGNLITGYDVTGSGSPQIYAVSGELNTNPIIPRIYEFKFNGTSWDSVWASVPGIPDQNTWCPLTVADLDGDGKLEVIWGPVNALSSNNSTPIRLLDYEAQGGGSDALGVPDGSGGYKANATWTMTDSVNYNTRPFRWVAADLKNNGKQELIFCTRAGGYRFGVISVDNIPNNGDGSEHWKMDTSGIGGGITLSTIYDMAVVDSTIYLFDVSGAMQPVYYTNGHYVIGKQYNNVVPGGTWKSAQVADIAGNGKKEIIIGSWSSGKVYLLQPSGDSLSTTEIADLGTLGCNKINGSAMGDFNGDGHIDFAFGSRSGYSTPDGAIYAVFYQGGDITSMTSYTTATVDSALMTGVQWDILSAGKTDKNSKSDAIVYSGIPRGGVAVPIVVLNTMSVDSLSTIGAARVDANHDYVPDNLNKSFKVMGVVNSINWVASSNGFSYTIQDGTGGIDLYKGGSLGPALHIGDRVIAKGSIAQYNGLTELAIGDLTNDITLVDTGRVVAPKTITLADLNKNGEAYESMLVTINGVAPSPANTATWPAANSNANIKIWDGYNNAIMFIDKDTELDGTTEPLYPINVTGVISQYTSATPANGGYEIEPVFYSNIVQKVAVPPSPYFFFSASLHQDLDNNPAVISDSSEVDTLSWSPSIDLNKDNVIYQVVWLSGGKEVSKVPSNNSGADTISLTKATDLLKLMAGKDTLKVDVTVLAKSVGTTEPITSSVDTLHITLINAIVTGIAEQTVPHTFFVDQNYPNPFNPTTNITFGLSQKENVKLVVYDILGRQVAVLLNNQPFTAGVHSVQFNASTLASGTYIYRLQAGNNVISKKMILMK